MAVKIAGSMSTKKKTEIRNKLRKQISEEKYQTIFGKDGALHYFVHKLHELTENMENYNDINDKPLKTLEDMVTTIVAFKNQHARAIGYLKKNFSNHPSRHKKLQALATITKEWLPTNGILYNVGSIGKGELTGDLITIHFHDRTVLRLAGFQSEIRKFKNKQAKSGLNPQDTALDDEVGIAYYKLKPMVNQIRFTMTSMVSELKKIQHQPKKRFSLWQ